MALELNGTTGVSLVQDGVVTQADLASGVGGKLASYAIVADVKDGGTNGGSATSGAFRTRDLAAEVSDSDGIVSLSSNQFTLQAGSYLIRWSAPAFQVDRHVTRLYNATDASVVQEGSAQFGLTTDGVVTRSEGSARVTIASSKAFEIQHGVETTRATSGFGVRADDAGATNSIYTIVEIFKEV